MPSNNLDLVSRFVRGTSLRPLPPAVRDAARKCFVDWFAVSLAALPDAGPALTRRQTRQWATRGNALNLYGDTGAAAPMAYVNGTLSHSLDYDDMHFDTAFHASGPTLAAVLALGMDRGLDGDKILNAFVTGYEVGATMGGHGLGPRLASVGWQPTGVLGHFSATAAAAALLELDERQVANALGLASTQVGGLQASGGSMAKPFHVGKAAMNGVMAAELALMGMDANTALLDDPRSGILGTLFQEQRVADFEALGQQWTVLGNMFKPFAACQLTHAAYETARNLAPEFQREGLREVRVHVNPLAIKVAGLPRATSAMEGKFSVAYCVSLGLQGHAADLSGFTDARVADAAVRELPEITRVLPADNLARCASRIELEYADGSVRRGQIDEVLGSPGRPLSWQDIDAKFLVVASPALLGDAPHLLDALHRFDEPGALAEVRRIVTSLGSRD